MANLCIRCAQLSLRNEVLPLSSFGVNKYRKFSSTIPARDDEAASSAKGSHPGMYPRSQQTQTTRQQPVIRRTTSQTKSTTPNGQVLRRTNPVQSGQILRRSGPPPSGQVLRRTNPTGQGTPRRRLGDPNQSGAQRAAKPDRRVRRAAAKEDDDVRDASVDGAVEDYINKYLDRPPNPTEELPYEPQNLTMKELRADYPNTPLSQEGLSETVVQKIQWLARRLPHGYQTPQQIAERFNSGELVRFESEEEKKQVLEAASALSKAVAERAEEEKGEVVAVETSTLTSLQEKETERSYLMNTVVKGDVEHIEKQRFPFMDNVAQALRNNETYGPAQSQKFMDRIYKLIPKGRGQQTQAQKQG